MTIRQAARQRAKMRLGIAGPSGSGKTYSALKLASGMATWDKIILIDTENGSGDLYAHLGAYNIIPIHPPYTTDRYIRAIKEAENYGAEVIIIDSVTHEWDGEGGLLDEHSKMSGNSFANWSKITPKHNAFLQAILKSTCHIITTVRKKQDYDMTQSEGRTRVTKIGLKEIQRDGFEYELTLNFELDMDHMATASKDRTELFMGKPGFQITPEIGKTILKWCQEGVEPLKTTVDATRGAEVAPSASSTPKKAVVDKVATPHLDSLKAELKSRGHSKLKDAVLALNEATKLDYKDLKLSEEEASKAMVALLQQTQIK